MAGVFFVGADQTPAPLLVGRMTCLPLTTPWRLPGMFPNLLSFLFSVGTAIFLLGVDVPPSNAQRKYLACISLTTTKPLSFLAVANPIAKAFVVNRVGLSKYLLL